MRELLHNLTQRLWTRRCHGCDMHLFHTHHLTRLGRRHYTGSWTR